MDDARGIVKYHNALNEITFQRFGQIDFDFFMALCSRLRDSEENEIVIGFDEFKKLTKYDSTKSEKRFIKELKSMNHKQLLSTGMIKNGSKIEQFVLFTRFVIDPDEKTISVKVNADYKYILNELTKNFTRFELAEFIGLESKHAKTLYRLLKQFRTTGKYIVSLDEFKRLFGVTKGYSNRLILDKIINPAVKALRKYFSNLECRTIYEKKPGRPVKAYEFTFDPEQARQLPDFQKREGPRKPANKFHNFDQRQDIDYDDLERKLTGN